MEVLCAALAGMTARVVTHPLDTVKTVAFTGFAGEYAATAASPALTRTTLASRASGLRGAARAVWQREGARGFYRGVGISVLGAAPGVALYLGSYYSITAACARLVDASRRSDTHSVDAPRRDEHAYNSNIDSNNNDSASDKSSHTAPSSLYATVARAVAQTPRAVLYLLSGLAAEAISCLFWVPVDVVKERLQSQPPSLHGRYRNSVHALRTVVRYEGLRGLYRGYCTTLGSYGPYSAIYFVCYESMCRRLQPSSSSSSSQSNTQPSFAVAFCAGACANVVAAVCTNPLELVKTRLQVQSTMLERSSVASSSSLSRPQRLYPYAYRGLLHGVRATAQRDGVAALWRGTGTRVLYAAPNAALTMAFFELLRARASSCARDACVRVRAKHADEDDAPQRTCLPCNTA